MADIPTKIFYVMYGWFDEHPDWSKVLEEKYMKTNYLMYNTTKLEKKSKT